MESRWTKADFAYGLPDGQTGMGLRLAPSCLRGSVFKNLARAEKHHGPF